MNKKELAFLKSKKFVVGVPVIARFKLIKPRQFASFKATRGEDVVRWKDILKLKKKVK